MITLFSLTDANWSIQPIEADGMLTDVQENFLKFLSNDDTTAVEENCV